MTLNDTSTVDVSGTTILGLYSAKGYLNVGPSATYDGRTRDLALGWNWGDQTGVYGYGEVNASGHIAVDAGHGIYVGVMAAAASGLRTPA